MWEQQGKIFSIIPDEFPNFIFAFFLSFFNQFYRSFLNMSGFTQIRMDLIAVLSPTFKQGNILHLYAQP